MRHTVFTLSCAFLVIVMMLPSCGKTRAPGKVSVSYTMKKTASPPQIDGVLEDACWKNVESIEFVRADDGGKTIHPTSVRMIHDGSFLYLAFECQDTDAASEASEFDGPVEDGDFVAALIDAGCDTTGYFLIEISPTGAARDAYVLNGGNGASVRQLAAWNCEKLKTSVAVYGGGAKPGTNDRFWTVEMAIPLNEMVTAANMPPAPGDVWRMNFCRSERADGLELSAAFPTGQPYMHRPYAFNALSFGE